MNIINEKVTQYIDGKYQSLSCAIDDIRLSAEARKIPIILRDTETMLMALVMSIKPERILEIGTAVGYSAACFAEVCPEAEITTIESRDIHCEEARKNLRRLGFADRVTVIEGDARDVLKDMADTEEEKYDFVFIDAAKNHYREYWDQIMKLVKPDSVIVSDNVLLDGVTVSDEYLTTRRDRTSMMRMREYLDYITDADGVYTSVLPVGDGLAVSVLKRMEQI